MSEKSLNKELTVQYKQVLESVNSAFPLSDPPPGLPIGLRQRGGEDIYGDGMDAEIMLKGGTLSELEINIESFEESERILRRYAAKERALNWRKVAGKGLTRWSMDSVLSFMMPAAKAYYYPAYIQTYALAIDPLIPLPPDEIGCKYEVAISVFMACVPPEDIDVWKNLRKIDASCLNPINKEPVDISKDYLLFVGQFDNAMKRAIREYVDMCLGYWKHDDCMSSTYSKELRIAKRVWLDEDFTGREIFGPEVHTVWRGISRRHP